MFVNKKLVLLGIIIVVLGLWVNSELGYEGDIPVENEDPIEVFIE